MAFDAAVDHISEHLQELGFTDYEARVYVALLQQAPATAYEISKVNGLARPNVYSALENLDRKRAVQRVGDEPARYVAVEPKVLLERIARSVVDRCDDLREQFETIKPIDRTDYVFTMSGAPEVSTKIREMIGRARRHIWVKAHEAELDPYADALAEAARRGISLLLVGFGSRERLERFRITERTTIYAHEGQGIVVGLGRHLITLTVDFNEALIVNMKDLSGAHTRSPPVVNMADSLIRHEVYLAEICERLGPALERDFGPALISLRSKYLPAEQVRALERWLARQRASPR